MSPEVIDLVAALSALYRASDPGPFYFFPEETREEIDAQMARVRTDLKSARSRASELLESYLKPTEAEGAAS